MALVLGYKEDDVYDKEKVDELPEWSENMTEVYDTFFTNNEEVDKGMTALYTWRYNAISNIKFE